jgi:hypothetical protein
MLTEPVSVQLFREFVTEEARSQFPVQFQRSAEKSREELAQYCNQWGYCEVMSGQKI